jgi:hypothetical protein
MLILCVDGTLIYERVPDKLIICVNNLSPSSHLNLKRRGYEELNGIDGMYIEIKKEIKSNL